MTATLTRPPVEPPHGLAVAMAPPATAPKRHRIWLLGVLLVAALAAVHLLLGWPMRGPIIQPDELGYIANAHFFTRGGLKPIVQYYPGFSLLLLPAWLFTKDPLQVWRYAIVVNALLAAGAGVLTWMLCGRLAPNLHGRRRLLVVGAVSLYPAFLLYSNLALSECLFVVLFGLVVLLAGRAFSGAHSGWWAGLGVATGALPLVHPRGYAVVAAVGVMAIVALRPWRGEARATKLSSLLNLAAGGTLGLGVTELLVKATHGATLTGFAVYQPEGIVSRSLTAAGAMSLVWELAGQFFYLSLATLGLLPLGLFFGLRALHAMVKGKDQTAATAARAFAAVAFLGVWVLSSMFMNLGDRTDKLIYGRYNEGVIAPLLVIALAEVLAPARRRRFSSRAFAARRWLVIGALSIGVSGAALAYGRSAAELHEPFNAVNTLGLFTLLHHYAGVIDVFAFAAVGFAVVAVLAIASWKAPVVVVVAIAGIFLATSLQAQTTYLVPGTQARAEQTVIATTLARASNELGINAPCIGYDPTDSTMFNFFATSFLLPDQRFAWFDGTGGGAPCGPLVLSGNRDFGTHYPGARLVTFERDASVTLWALPGPVQDALDNAGWLLPQQTPGVLPDEALHASLSAAPSAPPPIPSGAIRDIHVLANHDQGGSPWPDEGGLGQGAFAVRLLASWFTPDQLDSGKPFRQTEVALPETVLPGGTANLTVPLIARAADGSALPPGQYKVRVALYQEQAAPFSDNGLVLDVVVH